MLPIVLAFAVSQAPVDTAPIEGVTVRPSAHVDLQCRVTADGRLEQCRVLSERPADKGFGDAALRLSSTFRMKPRTGDGKAAAGGIVTIPMTFKSEDGSAPVAPPPGVAVSPPPTPTAPG